MTAEELKKQVAQAALSFVAKLLDEQGAHSSAPGVVLGIGTGSTVNQFIDLLAGSDLPVAAAVSSSEASTARLEAHQIKVLSLNEVLSSQTPLPVYVDGADEVDPGLALIKGGGGALTREKIIAQASGRFICIVDESKLVPVLGHFALPVEVVPMATELVAQQLRLLGARPAIRSEFTTDNGNHILDASGLEITDPLATEDAINQWPGVVSVGLFARRRADDCLVASASGIRHLTADT